jgi:nicotinamide-nucleotide amidase
LTPHAPQVHEDRHFMNHSAFLISAALAILQLHMAPLAASASGPDETKPLDYMIVVTGAQVLEGVYPDAHTPFLTRTLRQLGLRCVGSLTVDDAPSDIQRGLIYATNHAALVIVTGGLGPTPDDVTREAISEFTGIPLHEHPEVVAEIERRFNQSRDQLRPNLRRQAQVPTRGGYLKNSHGTAAGLIYETGSCTILALPGPPRELQPMVQNQMVPFLSQRFGVRVFGHSVTIRFVGIGQSLIDQTLRERVQMPPDIGVSSIFDGMRVDFTFSSPANGKEQEQRLRRIVENLRKHLGEYIYAEENSSLEDIVAKGIGERGGGAVALAEIHSGGYLAAALSGAKGANELIAAAFSAPTAQAMGRVLEMSPEEISKSGADLAKSIARAAASRTDTQWVIAVGPVESDQKGNRSAWLAFRMPEDRWATLRLSVPDSWAAAQGSLTTQVMDFLRRRMAAPGS